MFVIPAIYKNNVKYGGGVNSGESTINSISINGTTISPDENKNVDIIIPDNTELSNRVTSNEEAISTLNGSGEGSVSKTVDDALNEFAKTSELEDGTITVGNSKKLNGLTKDELFADTNNKIKEINNNLTCLGVNNQTLNTNNWNDIEKNEHTPLTFFTNWHNETDFPTVHGSGVIIPGLDSRYKYVLYIVGDGVLYTCLMVITANGYTMGTWYKASNE